MNADTPLDCGLHGRRKRGARLHKQMCAPHRIDCCEHTTRARVNHLRTPSSHHHNTHTHTRTHTHTHTHTYRTLNSVLPIENSSISSSIHGRVPTITMLGLNRSMPTRAFPAAAHAHPCHRESMLQEHTHIHTDRYTTKHAVKTRTATHTQHTHTHTHAAHATHHNSSHAPSRPALKESNDDWNATCVGPKSFALILHAQRSSNERQQYSMTIPGRHLPVHLARI